MLEPRRLSALTNAIMHTNAFPDGTSLTHLAVWEGYFPASRWVRRDVSPSASSGSSTSKETPPARNFRKTYHQCLWMWKLSKCNFSSSSAMTLSNPFCDCVGRDLASSRCGGDTHGLTFGRVRILSLGSRSVFSKNILASCWSSRSNYWIMIASMAISHL